MIWKILHYGYCIHSTDIKIVKPSTKISFVFLQIMVVKSSNFIPIYELETLYKDRFWKLFNF